MIILVWFTSHRHVSVAVFCEVYYDGFTPAEEEVARSRAEDNSTAQPRVVRHEYQHQHVTHEHLHSVEDCLPRVGGTHHSRTGIQTNQ